MTKTDYVIAIGLGLIVGGLAIANVVVAVVVLGSMFIGLAALFGLSEARPR